MMWSHNFCFVHIIRTGGTALTDAFGVLPWVSKDLHHFKHCTATRAKRIMGASWDNAHKFTLLRDPWDIVCSYYYLCCQFDDWEHCTDQWAATVRRIRLLSLEQFIDQDLSRLAPEGGFLARYATEPDIEILTSPVDAYGRLVDLTGHDPELEVWPYRHIIVDHPYKEKVRTHCYKDMEVLNVKS